MPPFDWTNFGMGAISALVPVVTTLAVWLGREFLPVKVPRVAIPIVAVVLATLLDLLTTYIAGGVFNPLVGALLGAAAVFLREVVNTFAEHGLKA
jgi:hypothetical protein